MSHLIFAKSIKHNEPTCNSFFPKYFLAFVESDKTTLGTSNSLTISLNSLTLLCAETPIRLNLSLFSLSNRKDVSPIDPVDPNKIISFLLFITTLKLVY